MQTHAANDVNDMNDLRAEHGTEESGERITPSFRKARRVETPVRPAAGAEVRRRA
jgi:hypothetical protein